MYMGDYTVIERQIGPFSFVGCSVSTGTRFIAKVDADKQELFTDRAWSERHPSACPFLRPFGARIVCTIHETSPAQCKAYRCVIARIRTPEGIERGYVIWTRALHSEDPLLREAWKEVEAEIAADQEKAEDRIPFLLARRGYQCE